MKNLSQLFHQFVPSSRFRRSAKRTKWSASRLTSAPVRRTEQLEDRTLLSVSVIAQDTFTVPPGGTSDLTLTVPDANGSTPTVFGVKVERNLSEGSTLDPSAMTVTNRLTGDAVPVLASRPDAENRSASIILVELPPGEFTIRVGGQRGTSGDAIATIFLPGDAGGDGDVGERDGQQARLANMQQTTGVTFVGSLLFRQLGFDPNVDQADASLDVDQDGDIDAFDIEVVDMNVQAPVITLGSDGMATGVTIIGDEDPPAFTVTAANDTGRSAIDRVTNDLSLTIDVADVSEIVSFEGAVDSGAFVDLIGFIDTRGGTFTLSETQINSLFGTTVRDTGSHTLRLRGEDEIGNVTNGAGFESFTFELDTIVPAAPTGLDLDTGSDSGTSSTDDITNDNTPTIVGDAEDNAIVALTSDLVGAVVGTDTVNSPFSVTTSTLQDGVHILTATAEDVAGNTSVPSTSLTVTIDTAVVPTPTFDLDPVSDTGTDDDQLTETTPVDFDGSTEAGAIVTLTNTGAMTTADGGGLFEFNGVTLPFVAGGGTEFTVSATDTAGNTATFSRTFTRNVAPDAVDDSGATFTTDEDNSLTQLAATGVLANDTDPNIVEGDVLMVSAVNGEASDVGSQITLASGALLTVNADGGFTYDPNGSFESLAAGESDTDSFMYTISDTNGGTDTAAVTLTINGVNDTPDAVDDTGANFTTDEDTSLTQAAALGVLVNDTDVDATDVLVVSAVNGSAGSVGNQITLTSGALLTVNTDGGFTYDPNGSFENLAVSESDTDSFMYTISDGNGGTDTATVTLTITGVNDTPDAVDDSGANFTTNEDSSLTQAAALGVLLNDTDVDASDTLVVSAVNGQAGDVGSQITLGTGALLTVNADGGFTYDPNGQFESLAVSESTTDSFMYSISDGNGGTDTATVTLTITGVNDAPDAVDDSGTNFTTDEDSSLTQGAAMGVLVNDTDVDTFDVLVVTAVNGTVGDVGNQVTLTSGALLTVNADGGFTYNPNGQFESLAAGVNDTDGFNYTMSDQQGGTDTATVTLTITGVNDAPDAVDDMLNALNQPVVTSLNVLLNDTDVDGDELFIDSVTLTSTDRSSVITISGDEKTLNYQPGASLIDTDGMTETFSYTIRDRVTGGLMDTATLTITVVANQPPVAANFDGGTTNEDTSRNVTVATLIGLATDNEGDPITLNSFDMTSTRGASITLSGDMTTLIFDPSGAAALQALSVGDAPLVDTFTYTLTDGTSASDPATISITVTPVNDAPIGVDDSGANFTTNEDSSLTQVAALGVLDNDTDVDTSDVLIVSQVNGSAVNVGSQITLGTGALLTVNADGGFTYNPNGQFESLAASEMTTDTFTYTVSDQQGGTDTATVTLAITGVNDAPIGVDDSGANFTTNEDSSLTQVAALGVLDNDTDVDTSDVLVVSEVNGSAGNVGSQITLGTGALLTVNADGGFTYNPNGQFESLAVSEMTTDTFTYTVSDQQGGTDTATVTLTITGVNDAPIGVDDSGGNFTTNEDSSLTLVAALGVLDNDTDVDASDVLVVSQVNGSAASVGNQITLGTGTLLTVNADGGFTYNPNGQFESLAEGVNASDTFAYTVSDQQGGTDTATVTLTITGVNDAPDAVDDMLNALNQAVVTSLNVLMNDSDVDGDELFIDSVTLTSTDRSSVITISGDEKTLNYQPGASLIGTDGMTETFSYTIRDRATGGLTDTATLTITVVANQAPVAADFGAGTTDEDNSLNVSVATLIGLATDNEGDPITLNTFQATSTSGASITLSGDMTTLIFDPTGAAALQALSIGDASVIDTFTYTLTDGTNTSDPATISVTVTPVNDTPDAVDDSGANFTTNEDTSLTQVAAQGVLANDSDVDASDTLVVSEVNGAAGDVGNQITLSSGALLMVNADGGFTYDPNGNFEDLAAGVNGTDNFMYTASDGNGGTDTAMVTLTITAVNDAPVVVLPTGPVAATEGTPLDLTDGAFSISDVDDQGGDLTATVTVGEGTLTVTDGDSGVVVSNSGSSSVTLVGTSVELQTLLRNATTGTITYEALDDPSTSTGLTVTVNDGGASGADPNLTGNGTSEEGSDSLTINITAVNDAPVVVLGAQSSTLPEDTPLDLTDPAFTVSDVDDRGNDLIATLTVGEGTVTVVAGASGVVVANSGTSSVTLTGTAAELQALGRSETDGTIVYATTQDPSTSTTLTLTVNDQGFTGTDPGAEGSGGTADTNSEEGSASVTIDIMPINDAPVVVLPAGPVAATEGTPLDLTDVTISVSDVDDQGGDLTATVTVGEGTLTVTDGDSGVVVSNSGTSSVTLVGTSAELQALLRDATTGTITYGAIDDPSTNTTLTVTVNDGGTSGTDPGAEGSGGTADTNSEQGTASLTINITAVNDAPVVVLATVSGTLPENTVLDLTDAAFSVSDVDDRGADLTATLAVGDGTITATAGDSGVVVSNSGTSSVTLVGTAVELQALGRGETTGTIDYATLEDPSTSTVLTITVNDGGATGLDPGAEGSGGTADTNSEQGSASVTINIMPINDAPTVAAPVGNLTRADGAVDDTIALAGVFTDVENDALTFSVVSSNTDLVVATIEDNNTLRLSYPVYTAAGDRTPAMITLKATETSTTENLFVDDVFTVTVTPEKTIEFFLVVAAQNNRNSITSPPRRATLESSITSVTQGQRYFVEVWFRDLFSPLRNETSINDNLTSTGIAGISTNILFDGTIASVSLVDTTPSFDDGDGLTGASAFQSAIGGGSNLSDPGFVRNFRNGGFNSNVGGLDDVGVDEFARAGILRFEADQIGTHILQLNIDPAVAMDTFLSPARGAGEPTASGDIDLSQISLGPSVTVMQVASGTQLGTQVGADVANGDTPTITTTVVREPTALNPDGTLADVPPSADWIHEWDSFWVEVWGTGGSGSLDAAEFDLNYNGDYFTATTVEYGAAFFAGDALTTTQIVVDDEAGQITGISGQVHTNIASEANVLLGRIRFESLGDDQVPIGESGTPYDLGIDVSNVTFNVDGSSVTPRLDNEAQDTELWPVVYDFDDSGTIGFADLSVLATALSTTVMDADSAATWFSDLDRSGVVSFGDVTLFSENFGLTRSTAGELQFPSGFQRRWSGSEIVSDGQNSLTAVFDAALAVWDAALDVDLPEIQLVVADLPGAELGHGSIISVGADGLPELGRVVIDSDAAGLGWYTGLDASPVDASSYDLLSVLTHEIGHAIGFSSAFAGFANSVESEPDGSSVFVTSIGDGIALGQTDDHVDADVYPNDLMVAFIDPGIRRSISTVNIQVIESSYAAAKAGDTVLDADVVQLQGGSASQFDDDLVDTAFTDDWDQV